MPSRYPSTITNRTLPATLKTAFLSLFMLAAMVGFAQDTTAVAYPWSIIEMTDYRMKPGVAWIKVPPPRGGMPIWIPIGGGVVVTGGVVYLLTRDQDGGPSSNPISLQDDLLTVDCGQSITFNPLLNDQGVGLRIVAVSSTANVDINWQASGPVTLSNLPNSGNISLTIVVEDEQGQMAQETATVMITSSPLSANDDVVDTDFETAVSGNVLTNDSGQQMTVTGFTGPTDGVLSLAPDGTFTFVPASGFTGTLVYTYTVEAACEQTATATLTITVGPPDCDFTVSIQTTPADCGLSNGTATATVDPAGAYVYEWSEGSTLSSITNLPSGAISLMVSDQNGLCTATASGSVGESTPAYIDSSSSSPGNCLGEGADILLTTSTPGSGPMIVTLNGNESYSAPPGVISLAAFTTLTPGTYELIVYDSSIGESCTESLTVSIADNSPPPIAANDNYTTGYVTPLGGNVLDNDQGLNISLSSIDNVVGGTVDFNADGVFTFDPFPDFVGEGGFTYSLTDACGVSQSATVIINVLPPDCDFTVSIQTTPADCGLSNGTATATVDPAGDYVYEWSEGSTFSSITNLPSGAISLTVSNQNGLCTAAASGSVGELAPAYIDSSSSSPGNCLGEGADILLTTSTPGSGPMIVTLNGNESYSAPPGTISLAAFTTLTPGTYELVVYDSSIGESCTESLTVSIADNSPQPIAANDNYTTGYVTPLGGNVLDNDQGLNISLSSIDNVVGGTVDFNANGAFTFDPFPDFVGEGGFTYSLTDACGVSQSATVIINVLPPDCDFTVSIQTTPADCGLNNGTATATVDPAGEYVYEWSDGSTLTSVTDLPAGAISLTVSDQNGLCMATASGSVGELAPAYIDSSSSSPGNCLGEGADIVLTTSTPGSGPMIVTLNGNESYSASPGVISLAAFTTLTPGTYELVVYDSSIGESCTESLTVSIADNSPQPVAANDNYTTGYVTPLGGNVLDNDQGLNISLSSIDNVVGGTVDFNTNGAFTFDPFPDFVGEGGFTYSLTDACGVSQSATVVINVLPPDCDFTVSIQTTPADCGLSNGTATATVDPAGDYVYEWSNGGTSPTVQSLPSGQISLTVSSTNGLCQSSASGQVGSLPPAYVETITPVSGYCTGEGADFIVESTNPGGGPLNVLFGDGQLIQIPTGLVSLAEYISLFPGEYDLTFYDSQAGLSCAQSFFLEIMDNTPPLDVLTDSYTTPYQTELVANVLANDEGLDLELTDLTAIIGGVVSFSGNGNFTFSPEDSFVGEGGFTYTATDACGNSDNTTVVIEVLPPDCSFSLSVSILDAHCGLTDGSATATVDEPGTYTFMWSDGQVGQSVAGLSVETYEVTAIEEVSGCSATVVFTVGEIPSQYISDLTVIEPACGSQGDIWFTVDTDISSELAINVNHPGGIENFIAAPGQVILSDYFPLQSGDYTITVEDPEQGPACAETVFAVLPETASGPGIILLESTPPSGPTASDGALLILIDPYTVPPFSILLNGVLWGSTSGEVFTIGDLESGAYTVQVIDALGCSSNVIETFLSFTQPLVYWETQWGAPAILQRSPAPDGVEHPVTSLPLSLDQRPGVQLTLQQGGNRYQLVLWSSPGQGAAHQLVQVNWQKGLSGAHWACFNGPAAGYFRSALPDRSVVKQGAYLYWATDVEWRPAPEAKWSLALHSALGRQDDWWWAGDLRVKMRW